MAYNPRLTLSQMRAFEAVARTGTVIDAAQDLRMSQPSVSTQVRAMENLARAQLFLRKGKSFQLTPLGAEVFQKVRAALALSDDIEQMLNDQRMLESGVLRIGYSAHQFAMPLISEFVRRYPRIRIEARCMASQDLIRRLDENLTDIALVTAAEPPAGHFSRLLRQERVVLMVPTDHPLVAQARTGVAWRDITDYPIVRREASSGTRLIFERAANSAGVRLQTMVEVGSWSSMADAVGAGIGVGIALEGEIAGRADLVIVPLNDPTLAAGHYVTAPENMQLVAAIEAFFEIATGTETHRETNGETK